MKAEISLERIARSKRIQSLIKMTGLSRRAFAHKIGLPSGTIQHWEDAEHHGLSEKGAKKLVKALHLHNIECTYEWLMYGTGAAPRYRYQLKENLSNLILQESPKQYLNKEQQLTQIKTEVELFLQHHPDTIEWVVTDDAMQPFYLKGEVVAGIRRYGEDIAHLIGKDCIVLVEGGNVYLRRICKGNVPGHFHLTHLNPDTTVVTPYFYDAKLVSAAEVIWVRRQDV